MNRPAAALVALIALTGCAQHRESQPRARAPTPTETNPGSALDEAARLNKAAEALYDEGKFREALPLAERSLALREKALGPAHAEVAAGLNNIAELHRSLGLYAQAEPLFVRSLEIAEQALGASHPALSSGLNNLAELYREQGAFARAEPLYLRALAIQEKALGPDHPDVAVILNNLALLYKEHGAYAQAEPLYLRALAVREKALGSRHPDVANSLNTLAGLYRERGEHARAEPLFLRALDIREQEQGAAHPAVASTLNNLAGLYRERGEHARAEPLFLRALDIWEKRLGPTHPAVATVLSSLALLYKEQGEHARAEPRFVRAHSILEQTLGAMHPDVATNLANLASLYQEQGAYARAEPLLRQALDIREKVLGATHPDVATSLNSLATLYHARGAYAQAEPLVVRALEIQKQALGTMHPDVAQCLNNLAMLYTAQGAYARAEPLFRDALNIWERALGAMHPDFASGLSNLAVLHQVRGEYARAAPLYLRALEIRQQALGGMHPDVALSLNNLGTLYQAQGAHARAQPLFSRAAELREAHLRIQLAHLSEARKRDLMLLLRGETHHLISLHAHERFTSSRAIELALTTVLRRKGRVLDSLAETQATLRAHTNPQLRGKIAQLEEASSRLAGRQLAPFDPRTAAAQKAEITALRARIDDLEGELNNASVELRMQAEPVTIDKVQAALPHGAALVELVRYRRYDIRRSTPQGQWQEERYVAYVLTKQGPPQGVALGDAARIDAEVDAVLAAMRKDASDNIARAALQKFDALVYAPIRNRLSGISHVILSPDSKLNLVPFEALIDAQGRYELDQRLVSYVTSGRDLLRLAALQPPRSPATIVADPEYGPPGMPHVRLAGTLAEANEIQEYLPGARMLTQGRATKAALAAIAGPSVLHVATHAFYTRGTAGNAAAPATHPAEHDRGMFVQGAVPSLPPPPPSEDPIEALDRTGLALAGANLRLDGTISARELAGQDWGGTQLVVLSACGTAVGAVPSGEGVYGLRRALVLAGARSQVVSLWNVNDSSAPELMREFYAELARGKGRAEALRQAKLRLLRQPRFAHPYYWAAFIAAGDWAPLEKGILRTPPAPSPRPQPRLRRSAAAAAAATADQKNVISARA